MRTGRINALPAFKILESDRGRQAEIVAALVPRIAKLDQKQKEFRSNLPAGMRRWKCAPRTRVDGTLVPSIGPVQADGSVTRPKATPRVGKTGGIGPMVRFG